MLENIVADFVESRVNELIKEDLVRTYIQRVFADMWVGRFLLAFANQETGGVLRAFLRWLYPL
ncbi:hypothetical protein HHE02_09620 [Helicobacter heilmannii]|uniref:Uncharacterized protein n=1 Tax=Helicobacter heilmannii TaxID=35817 RepID=A0A0K2XMC7_HELHE|nr:hypothetical protein BN341_1190 [Helicobacter heilmannii ASB1.4]CRF46008.1 hypothetical protein HHE014_09930 [Helicobacter heilmannii]CRF47668.1 hypothetical protein HHE02_09620 [Helicobacter heilmannii]CRF49711.1 hypothetical protein HHE03_13740 [Helicobacter heilmannii]CRF50378.1 hypothetical protein HHE06_02030 [Helicobacter heilmannii]